MPLRDVDVQDCPAWRLGGYRYIRAALPQPPPGDDARVGIRVEPAGNLKSPASTSGPFSIHKGMHSACGLALVSELPGYRGACASRSRFCISSASS